MSRGMGGSLLSEAPYLDITCGHQSNAITFNYRLRLTNRLEKL
jgi:hypothetical protein